MNPSAESVPDDASDQPGIDHDEPGIHTFDIDIGVYLPEGVELAEEDPSADPAADEEGEVDTRLLQQIEDEFDEVDSALAAIDAGEAERSPLLRRLLGEDFGA